MSLADCSLAPLLREACTPQPPLGPGSCVQAVRDEAFTHMDGRKLFVRFQQPRDLFPYLLVNIGSGVSMIKVRSREDARSLSVETDACWLLGCGLLPLGVTCYCAGCHGF